MPPALPAGWPSVFAGLVYGVLAWLARGRSIVGLGIAVALDDDTLAFAEGTRPPARLVTLTQLAEYDAVYGPSAPA